MFGRKKHRGYGTIQDSHDAVAAIGNVPDDAELYIEAQHNGHVRLIPEHVGLFVGYVGDLRKHLQGHIAGKPYRTDNNSHTGVSGAAAVHLPAEHGAGFVCSIGHLRAIITGAAEVQT